MPAEVKDAHRKAEDGTPMEPQLWRLQEQDRGCSRGVHPCAYCRRVGHSFRNCRDRAWKGSGRGKQANE